MTTITPAQVKELRELTGAGMMDCKRALAESDGDVEKAKQWLREKGRAIAEKKASRTASEGLIRARISPDGRTAAIVELNCETDFVARNEGFGRLVEELMAHVLDGGAQIAEGDVEGLLNRRSAPEGSTTLRERIGEAIAVLGENIELRRFVRWTAPDDRSRFDSYIHPPGKLGVLVELRAGRRETLENPAFGELTQDLAMHVAAAAPDYLSRAEVPAEVIEREKRIYREQGRNEGKPEKMLDKIAEGKLGKFYRTSCLLEQDFVKDPEVTIEQWLAKAGQALGDPVALRRFERFKVGG